MKWGTRGFTVVETLIALLLFAGVVQLCAAVAAAQRRGLLRMVERGDVLEAERTVWWVLSTETAAGRAGRDWAIAAPDVLELRAFRGRALICPGPVDPEGWVAVRYRGWRLPEPAKDSVLTLDVAGLWRARRLASRSTIEGSCRPEPGERSERWRLDPPSVHRLVLARLFERGSYHLEDASFRYRRGAGGRQPLTTAVLDESVSGLSAGPGTAVEVRFRGVAGRRAAGGAPVDSGWVRPLHGG
jgi:hypothetical protein